MMRRKARPKLSRKKSYGLDQCALYRVTSKKKLCSVLLVTEEQLKSFASAGDESYHEVSIPAEFNELTGKVKKARVASVPNFRLKKVHSRVHKLLSSVSAPIYAHGSISGRSYISNAQFHVGGSEVLTMDLMDYFRSVKRDRIFIFFKDTMQCSPDVAGILSNILTYQGALPVGSPASAILAMWSCKTLFDKMNAMALGESLKFSTFVDDISFSGDKIPGSFVHSITKLCRAHGFSVHERKTRFFRRGAPALVTGIILRGGGIEPTYSRFCGMRKLSNLLSRDGAGASVNDKSAKHSLRGLLIESRRIQRLNSVNN